MSSPTVHWASLYDEFRDAFSDTFPHLLTNKFSTVLIAVGCWGCRLAADETIIQDVSQADNNQNWIISLCNGRKWCNSKVKSLNNYVNPQYPHTFNSFLQNLLCLHLLICLLLAWTLMFRFCIKQLVNTKQPE